MTDPWPARRAAGIAVTVVVLLSLAGYLRTMPPTITWWFGGSDSGDLVSAADVLGVPHPTGYPLFVLLGHGASRVPLGETAGRVNAMNAVLAALGAGGIALAVWALARQAGTPVRGGAAVLAALAVATSALYWSQAIIGEVYALHAALAALVLWLWARRSTHPILLGAAHGLSLTNHLTSVILLGAALIGLLARDRPALSWRWAGWFLLGLVLPLGLYALLPLRAAQHPAANWGDPSTLDRFIAHVTGRQYRSLVDWRDVAGASRTLPPLLRLLAGDLPLWAPPAAAVGFYRLLRTDRQFALFSGTAWSGVLLFTAVYRVPDRAPYLLPALVITGIWAGVGLVTAAGAVQRWAASTPRISARIALPAATALAALLLAVWAVRAGVRTNLHGDDSALVFARSTLASLPANATYYSGRDDVTFALWYAQRSLGLRRDVRVIDVRGPQPQNTHTRAHAGGDTLLSLANVRLFVPEGAVAPGSVIGLGVGGVPAPNGRPGAFGIVVTAAGGLLAPVAVLIAPPPAGGTAASTTPALLDTATGALSPCLRAGVWIACRVARVGAYTLAGTQEPPPSDALLQRALASLPASGAAPQRPLIRVIAVVLVAAVAGGAGALLLSARPHRA